MKQFSILAALLSLTFATYCGGGNDGRRDATTVGAEGWVFEGWACAPDAAKAKAGLSPAEYCQDDDKKDYLYLKFSARSSERAIRAGSIAMKQTTCRRAARDLVAGDGLSKILGDYVEQASGVSDGQSTGHAIVTQSAGKISGIGLYDCCSLNQQTGRCAKDNDPETWEDCQCVGYFKYPGGQRAFEATVQEVSVD
jgi:hypothetical protein